MDKNLDQLDQLGTSSPSDKLHVRRNGQDFSISVADFSASSSGSVNSASNVGTGAGKVFKTRVGSDLQFKSIGGAGNVAVSNTVDDITISVSPDSTKADKVVPTASGNVAALSASGNLQDSGVQAASLLQDITGESIGDLLDVDLTGISTNDTLRWDGTKFVSDMAAQPLDGTLTVLSGVTPEPDHLIYFDGVDTATTAPLTPLGRSFIASTSAGDGRDTLGLGTSAVADLTTSTDDETTGRVLRTDDVYSPAWTSPSLQNGWTDNPTEGLVYRVVLGMLQFSGVITAGTKTDGTLLFTLPAGSRPSGTRLVPVGSLESGGGVGAYVNIGSDGSVTAYNVGPAQTQIVFNTTVRLT